MGGVPRIRSRIGRCVSLSTGQRVDLKHAVDVLLERVNVGEVRYEVWPQTRTMRPT